MAHLTLSQVSKSFGTAQVLKPMDLTIDDGEFAVFVGPSGCGKSTLLRTIAGLEEASGGEIRIDGDLVNDVDSSRRGLSMVFQNYALYPHMTIFDNMAFGLKIARTPKPEIKRRVDEAAAILEIDHLLERYPKTLSGGQRQRVAIGRAIVRDPKIFLFDEPLSNLDAELRVQMRIEVARLHERLGATMIYVTHDQVEAMTLADKIVVLRDGVIEQVGAPLDLYNAPVNRFVAGFIGSPAMNFLAGRIARDMTRDRTRDMAPSGVRLPSGNVLALPGAVDLANLADGTEVTIGVRPEHVRIVDPAAADLRATVLLAEHLGSVTLVHVEIAHAETGATSPLVAEMPGQVTVRTGATVGVDLAPEGRHLFGPDGMRLAPAEALRAAS